MVPRGTWNLSFPSLKSRSWCWRCRLSPYKCPRSTCETAPCDGSTSPAVPTPGPPSPVPTALASRPHPMPQRLGEASPHLPGRLEELVGEMLGEEGKHQVGAPGIGFELVPQQEPLRQELGVGELPLPCGGRG